MSLTIANNVSALNAQNNLTRSSNNLSRSIERLSSGFKVNRGADGPAALVISERQRAQISGLRAAIDNTEKAVSVVQTAEGALSEINDLLVKVRSLAIDSANSGVNDADALAANQAEIDNAIETINRIANNTQFGTKKLLDGSAGITGSATDANVSFVSGVAGTTQTGDYAVTNVVAATRGEVVGADLAGGNLSAAETLSINGVNITLDAGLNQAGIISRVNEFSSQTGVVAEADNTTATAIRLRTEDFGAAASFTVVSNQTGAGSAGFNTTVQTGTGTDISGEIDGIAATGVGNVLTAATGSNAEGLSIEIAASAADAQVTAAGNLGTVNVQDNSLVFQIGANQNQTVNIGVQALNPDGLALQVDNDSGFASLNDIDVTSAQGAQDTLALVDSAIGTVTNVRGTLGAFQANTLESTANNLRTTLENTVSAESVIRDTDFAEEISTFTNSQILVQAGTSVLSNANQTSQLVLSLLG